MCNSRREEGFFVHSDVCPTFIFPPTNSLYKNNRIIVLSVGLGRISGHFQYPARYWISGWFIKPDIYICRISNVAQISGTTLVYISWIFSISCQILDIRLIYTAGYPVICRISNVAQISGTTQVFISWIFLCTFYTIYLSCFCLLRFTFFLFFMGRPFLNSR